MTGLKYVRFRDCVRIDQGKMTELLNTILLSLSSTQSSTSEPSSSVHQQQVPLPTVLTMPVPDVISAQPKTIGSPPRPFKEWRSSGEDIPVWFAYNHLSTQLRDLFAFQTGEEMLLYAQLLLKDYDKHMNIYSKVFSQKYQGNELSPHEFNRFALVLKHLLEENHALISANEEKPAEVISDLLSSSITPETARKLPEVMLSKFTCSERILLPDKQYPANLKLKERIRVSAEFSFAEFRHSQLNDEDMCLIADELRRNVHWKSLNVAENRIGDVGASHLARALQNNTILTDLVLDYNNISDIGVHVLASVLPMNNILWSLSLSSNQITASGMMVLADASKAKVSLRNVSLQNNKITDRSIDAIGHLLTDKKTLFVINITRNGFSDVQKIQDIAKKSNVRIFL
ncbi:unnamed protein product [Rotaria socialis]|uniref:Uncharacterized protein n=1 Tax=Rotaria socialis TaxID=392032 RepID=A0A821H2G0_9BILA|nr:unnamed protein product [Rotaria socialis]CAF4678662.1 unnamed protein product [Rotaria socialis]